MLGFLLKKPHLIAGTAIAVLSTIANGTSTSSSPPSDKTSESHSISQRLLGITSLFPVSARGWGFPSKHHFFGPQTDSICGQGCLSKNSIAHAASVIVPAVVHISTIHGVPTMGTGTIITPDGWILTCAHIVTSCSDGIAYGWKYVDVKLQDGHMLVGEVAYTDCHADMAIVKINSNTSLPSAKFGKSAQLRPGDWVVSVGYPYYMKNTITAGIVSCVNRRIDRDFHGPGGEFIQTDCVTNKGSSGGPLVNLDGEIVGMNVSKFNKADGIYFAVPIDVVVKIMKHFEKRGRVVRPWLGILMYDLNPVIIPQLKEKDRKFPDVTSGVLVTKVAPGATGERAGFQVHDVIISFDGKPVKSRFEIEDIIDDRVGVPIRVDVVRQGNKHVKLSVKPEEP